MRSETLLPPESPAPMMALRSLESMEGTVSSEVLVGARPIASELMTNALVHSEMDWPPGLRAKSLRIHEVKQTR